MRNIRPGTRSSGTGARREVSDSSGRGQWVGCLAGAADAFVGQENQEEPGTSYSQKTKVLSLPPWGWNLKG